MNVTRISNRVRTVIVNERFGLAVYLCRIVLYWTSDDGQVRHKAFFCTSTISERAAYLDACAYMGTWLSSRLKEKERRAA